MMTGSWVLKKTSVPLRNGPATSLWWYCMVSVIQIDVVPYVNAVSSLSLSAAVCSLGAVQRLPLRTGTSLLHCGCEGDGSSTLSIVDDVIEQVHAVQRGTYC